MPWTSDQLPWTNFKYPKPARPSGQFEPLNYMTGPPILIGGGTVGSPDGPPVMLPGNLSSNTLAALQSKPPIMHGIGNKPYYPGMTLVQQKYSPPPIIPGMPRVIQALRLKGG